MEDCDHSEIAIEPADQTVCIVCLKCNLELAVEWGENHIQAGLWNQAVRQHVARGDAEKLGLSESPANAFDCAFCRPR